MGDAKEVSVPALEDEVAQPAPAPPGLFAHQRTVGLGVGAAGIVGVALGAIFGLGAISTNNDAETHCRTSDLCTADGLKLKDSARSKATVSTVFFLVGAAAIGGGAILFLTAPEDGEKPKGISRLRLEPSIGLATSGELSLKGDW
jgi:hypothetical protein